MQEQLAGVVKSLESAQSKLRKLTDSIPESAWNKRPGPDRWSAAECVEHLNITTRSYLPRLRDALAKAREGRPPEKKHYRRDATGWFLSTMIGPLRHIGNFRFLRVKTTPNFVPRPNLSRTQVLSDFVRLQGELISLVQSADGLPIDEVKIVSPFGDRGRYSAYSAFVIIARHEHRHLQQAEEAAR